MKTITGTFFDSRDNPISNGRLHFHLNQNATAEGRTSPRDVWFQLNALGELPDGSKIWANDELEPVGTYYRMAGLAVGGGVVLEPEFLEIAGAEPIDLNAIIPGSLVPGYGPALPGPGTPTAITITPGSATLAPGQQLQFTAVVEGSTNQGVSWMASQGSIDPNGLYTAPSNLNTSIGVTITAVSVVAPSVGKSIAISVQPTNFVEVLVTPTSPVLTSGQTLQFSATVTGTLNVAVTWATAIGTITQNGLFTAPTVTAVTQGMITVTSVADPTAQAVIQVTVMPGTQPGQLDLLDWMVMAPRATQHLVGDPSAPYDAHWLDTDPGYPVGYPSGCIWYIKNKLGNPWDVLQYDQNYISHWITENGDSVDAPACQAANGTSCWLYAKAYKRHTVLGLLLPRYFSPGSSVAVDADVSGVRTTDCEATSTVTHLGPTHCITTGPFKISWGGSIDHGSGSLATGPNYDSVNGVDTIKNEYYYTKDSTQPSGYADLEETYYVKGFGRIAWYYYVRGVFQKSTINTVLASGGAPTPNFPCGPGKPWFVGPGVIPPTPSPNFPNLEAVTGWATAAGISVGGTDPNPVYSMQQGVAKAGQTGTLELTLQGHSGLWANLRASLSATHVPVPPDGPVALDGMIYLDSAALASVSLDTIFAQNNIIWHSGIQIDYTTGGTLRIQDSTGAWVSTGIVLGALAIDVWHTFKIEFTVNLAGGTVTRVAFTLDGNRQTIPTNIAVLNGRNVNWANGTQIQLGLGSDSLAQLIHAYYVDLGYTFG